MNILYKGAPSWGIRQYHIPGGMDDYSEFILNRLQKDITQECKDANLDKMSIETLSLNIETISVVNSTSPMVTILVTYTIT